MATLATLSSLLPVWFQITLEIVLWVYVGFQSFLFVLPLIPTAIERLANAPNRHRPEGSVSEDVPIHEKSDFGFFTFLEPGRAKIIERGKRFIWIIMHLAEHTFNGQLPGSNLTPRQPAYWQVVESPDSKSSLHPIPPPWRKWRGWRFFRWLLYSPISLIWWGWKRWTYHWTGGIFTGFYPFQRVRVYPLEHFEKTTAGTAGGKKGEITLKRRLNWSDEYRVADFQFPLFVPASDTKDLNRLSILTEPVCRVINPYQTAYNSDDDWGKRLLAIISSQLTAFMRHQQLENVLAAEDAVQAGMLEAEIIKVGKEEGQATRIGITIINAPILDISATSAAVEERLGDVGLARMDRDARKIRAEGEAEPVRQMGKALKEFPEGAIVPQIEGQVRTAQAAVSGKGQPIVIVGGGQQVDPTLAAILAELRKKNGDGKAA